MRLRVVFRTFGVLLSGHVIAKIIALASAFVLGRSLGPTNLGVYGSALTVVGYLLAISNVGQDATGIRLVSMDPPSASQLRFRVFQIRVALGVVLTLISIVAAIWLGWPMGLVLPLSASVLVYSARADWLLLGTGRPTAVVVATIAREASFLLLVAFIMTHRPSLTRAAVCFLAAEIVWSVATQVMATRLPDLSRKVIQIRELVVQGVPIAVMSFMSLTYNKIDTPMLAASRGAGEAGLYYAAYTIMFAIMGIPATLSRSALPEMSRSHASVDGDPDRPVEVLTMSAAIVGGAVAVVLASCANGILRIAYGSAFVGATGALKILALILPLNFASVILLNRLVAVGNRKPLAIGTAAAAVLNVVLLLLFIPRWGMIGAAWATVASESVLLIVGAASFSNRGVSARLALRLSFVALTATGTILVLPLAVHLPTAFVAIVSLAAFMVVAFPLLLGAINGPARGPASV